MWRNNIACVSSSLHDKYKVIQVKHGICEAEKVWIFTRILNKLRVNSIFVRNTCHYLYYFCFFLTWLYYTENTKKCFMTSTFRIEDSTYIYTKWIYFDIHLLSITAVSILKIFYKLTSLFSIYLKISMMRPGVKVLFSLMDSMSWE